VIYFFIGNQINFIENISALSIQEVYKMTQKYKRQRNNKTNPAKTQPQQKSQNTQAKTCPKTLSNITSQRPLAFISTNPICKKRTIKQENQKNMKNAS
jgi:hypothetical protein